VVYKAHNIHSITTTGHWLNRRPQTSPWTQPLDKALESISTCSCYRQVILSYSQCETQVSFSSISQKHALEIKQYSSLPTLRPSVGFSMYRPNNNPDELMSVTKFHFTLANQLESRHL